MAPYLPLRWRHRGALDQMVSAYSAFPNKGIRVEPHMIRKVVDRDGAVMKSGKRLLTKSSVSIRLTMVSMMRGVVQGGTASAAQVLGVPWPERPARSTITPTFGSWATRRHTSLESGWVIPGERSRSAMT